MNGNNIYTEKLPQEGIIVLGNEANGISQNIEKKVTHKISIPRFSTQTESLNVATAAAIVLSEFKRINYNN
jgi:TrmH family RNA methyltransferase